MRPTARCISVAIFGAVQMLTALPAAEGGTIVQDQWTGAPTFVVAGPHSTFAQSFTAEDRAIASIGFGLADANAFLGGLQFTVTLFVGEGTSGPVLGSVTRAFTSLPPLGGYPTFFDFDFSGVVLVPGRVYTAKLESASGRGQTYESYFLGDVYPGGMAYHNDVPYLAPTGHGSDVGPEDMVFRVLPVSSPTIVSLSAAPSLLWPPNHRMVPVAVSVSLSDGSPAAPVCGITNVRSNEFPMKPGQADWAVVGPLTALLRAERAGSGRGRIYTITVTCMYARQWSDAAEVTVTVPHDARH